MELDDKELIKQKESGFSEALEKPAQPFRIREKLKLMINHI